MKIFLAIMIAGAGMLLAQQADAAPDQYRLHFAVTPSDGYVFQARLTPGASATVSWNASPTFHRCVASGGWNGAKAVQGSEVVTVKKKSKILHLTCMSENGLRRSTEYVLLRSDSTAVSVDLSLDREDQHSATLRWNSKNASECTAGIYCPISPTELFVECYKSNVWKEAPWSGGKSASGVLDIPYPSWTGRLRYGMTCKNDRSSVTTREIEVDWTKKVRPALREVQHLPIPIPPPYTAPIPPSQTPSPVPQGIAPVPTPHTPPMPTPQPPRGRGAPTRGTTMPGG